MGPCRSPARQQTQVRLGVEHLQGGGVHLAPDTWSVLIAVTTASAMALAVANGLTTTISWPPAARKRSARCAAGTC